VAPHFEWKYVGLAALHAVGVRSSSPKTPVGRTLASFYNNVCVLSKFMQNLAVQSSSTYNKSKIAKNFDDV